MSDPDELPPELPDELPPELPDTEIVAEDWERLGLRVPFDLADVLRVTHGLLR